VAIARQIHTVRQTKIIATIGPSSSTPETLTALVDAGVDVFRLNFSHGDHESHADSVARIRNVCTRAGRLVAIMQDLAGPKIRTGPLDGDRAIPLDQGSRVLLAAGSQPSIAGRIYTPYAPLIESAKTGDRLLLDDGKIELKVEERRVDGLAATVITGGVLGAHKGINAPGVDLPPSALTDKDVGDLHFGLSLGVDIVALSFVQTAQDVARARAIIDGHGRATPIVAKIERPAAVDNLREILALAQGVMVARGDLGLELPLEQVPRVQKEIIRTARSLGAPAIVATQVLESMRTSPRPTRAEVSDAANAVDEGADAIMLAGETAAGAYPVRSVQTLDAIVRVAESAAPASQVTPEVDPTGSLHGQALAEAAVTLARTARASAIVAVTHEGKTARLLSALRPSAPILAAAPSADVAGPLAILWGVAPFITDERSVDRIDADLVARGLLTRGSIVVFINVSREQDRADANFLHVRRID
jgi:pyruvate kinase